MELALSRVAEKESVNKMSLHNLATVFGPTLLRPAEKDSKIPANPTQPISMGDSWSLEVMAQVSHTNCPPSASSGNSKKILRGSFFFRSRCCCISFSWRRSPHRTVNGRASSSPLKYRADTWLCLPETLWKWDRRWLKVSLLYCQLLSVATSCCAWTQEGATGPLKLKGCEVLAIHVSHYLIHSMIPSTLSDFFGTSSTCISPPGFLLPVVHKSIYLFIELVCQQITISVKFEHCLLFMFILDNHSVLQ